MCQKGADGMANSVDPDQTAPPNNPSFGKLRNVTIHKNVSFMTS